MNTLSTTYPVLAKAAEEIILDNAMFNRRCNNLSDVTELMLKSASEFYQPETLKEVDIFLATLTRNQLTDLCCGSLEELEFEYLPKANEVLNYMFENPKPGLVY